MERVTAKVGILAILISFLAVAPVFADANDVAALQTQVQDLNSKIANLEKQLRAVESKTQPQAAYIPSAETSKGLAHFAKDINMGGYIDVQWNDNFRQPRTTTTAGPEVRGANNNVGRIFDRYAETFAVNQANLYFEKVAKDVGAAGFRIDLLMGEDSLVVNADGNNDMFNLEQAYVEYNAPLGIFEGNSILPNHVDIKAGRFVTLAGSEVIKPSDNWNISRSFMFGYAIPYAHTGVRTQFGLFKDFFTAYLGLNNGWDNPIDNNSFKTLESGLSYSPLKGVSIMHALYWGAEGNNDDGSKRWLLSNTANYSITDKLSFLGDFTIGAQHKVLNTNSLVRDTQNPLWYGVAGSFRYQFTNKFAVAMRAELFRDEKVFRTTGAGNPNTGTLFGLTPTAEYKLSDDLIARAEFRYDKANDNDIFPNAGKYSSQTSLGAQLIYII